MQGRLWDHLANCITEQEGWQGSASARGGPAEGPGRIIRGQPRDFFLGSDLLEK